MRTKYSSSHYNYIKIIIPILIILSIIDFLFLFINIQEYNQSTNFSEINHYITILFTVFFLISPIFIYLFPASIIAKLRNAVIDELKKGSERRDIIIRLFKILSLLIFVIIGLLYYLLSHYLFYLKFNITSYSILVLTLILIDNIILIMYLCRVIYSKCNNISIYLYIIIFNVLLYIICNTNNNNFILFIVKFLASLAILVLILGLSEEIASILDSDVLSDFICRVCGKPTMFFSFYLFGLLYIIALIILLTYTPPEHTNITILGAYIAAFALGFSIILSPFNICAIYKDKCKNVHTRKKNIIGEMRM